MVSLLCLGCASASNSGPAPEPVIERVGLPGESERVRIEVDRIPARHRIDARRADIWAVLPEAFDSLRIRLEFADPGTFQAGNTRFIAPRQIAGRPKSAYLRCGMGPAGHLADTHRVTMSVITELHSIGTDSTDVFTQVVATASTAEGTSTEPVICASTGALERAVADLVNRRVSERKRVRSKGEARAIKSNDQRGIGEMLGG